MPLFRSVNRKTARLLAAEAQSLVQLVQGPRTPPARPTLRQRDAQIARFLLDPLNNQGRSSSAPSRPSPRVVITGGDPIGEPISISSITGRIAQRIQQEEDDLFLSLVERTAPAIPSAEQLRDREQARLRAQVAEDEEIFRRLDELAREPPPETTSPPRGRPREAMLLDEVTLQDIIHLGPDQPRGRTMGWTVGETVGVGIVNPRAARVAIPTFEIASNPTVSMADIRARRFDLLDRTHVNPSPAWALVQEILRQLDARTPETPETPPVEHVPPAVSLWD